MLHLSETKKAEKGTQGKKVGACREDEERDEDGSE